MPLEFVAGRQNPPSGSMMMVWVARWFRAIRHRIRLAVYVGSAVWFLPAVAVAAVVVGPIGVGVTLVAVPAAV